MFNLKRCHELMKYYNIDCIIFTDPLSLKYFGYYCYFDIAKEWMLKPGGSNNNGAVNYCIIPLDKKPIYIINCFSISNLKTNFLEEILLYGKLTNFENITENISTKNSLDKKIDYLFKNSMFENPMDAISYILKKYNLNNSKIALEEDGLNKLIIHKIKTLFYKCKFFNGSELIRLIRMIKTEEEIENITKCLKLTQIAMEKALKNIKTNITLGKIKKYFKQTIYNEEAVYEHFFIMPNGLGGIDDDSYIIENNKIIGVDAGIIYKNYVSDTGITLFNGEYSKNDLNIYKKLHEIIENGVKRVKSGVLCFDIYKKMIDTKLKYSLDNASFECHGIGQSFREYPIINGNINFEYFDGFETKRANFYLEKNMVINFEISLHIPNIKSFQIEKTIIVTDNGCKELGFLKRKEPIFNVNKSLKIGTITDSV